MRSSQMRDSAVDRHALKRCGPDWGPTAVLASRKRSPITGLGLPQSAARASVGFKQKLGVILKFNLKNTPKHGIISQVLKGDCDDKKNNIGNNKKKCDAGTGCDYPWAKASR